MKEQHEDELDCLKCSFCQRTFVCSFNLKKHYRVTHKLEGQDLKRAVENKNYTVNRQLRGSALTRVRAWRTVREHIVGRG